MLMILAVVFAVALTLTVVLICISYTRTEAEEIPPAETTAHTVLTPSPPEETTYLPLQTDTETTEWITTAEPLPPIEDLGNGLSFSSNGDGTCTLTDVGSCTDVCVVIPDLSPHGERVTAIAPRAFYGCTSITAVQIPASVTRIGDLAFGACSNLVYISVRENNYFYRDIDGILYTADLGTLLYYPPMRAGSSISIDASTTRICEMAFYNCAYLTHVNYAGSAMQWHEIEIGGKNYSLTAASKTFSSHAGK